MVLEILDLDWFSIRKIVFYSQKIGLLKEKANKFPSVKYTTLCAEIIYQVITESGGFVLCISHVM